MAFWAWLAIWRQPLEDKEPLALAECALFTSGTPVTLESADLVGSQLVGRGAAALEQLSRRPRVTGHRALHKHFLSTSLLMCLGLV